MRPSPAPASDLATAPISPLAFLPFDPRPGCFQRLAFVRPDPTWRRGASVVEEKAFRRTFEFGPRRRAPANSRAQARHDYRCGPIDRHIRLWGLDSLGVF